MLHFILSESMAAPMSVILFAASAALKLKLLWRDLGISHNYNI